MLIDMLREQTRQNNQKEYLIKFQAYEKHKGREYYGFGFPEMYLLSVTPLVAHNETIDLFGKVIQVLGTYCSELKGDYLKGLAYNTAVEYSKPETPLDRIALQNMIETLEPYTLTEGQKVPKFQLNLNLTFKQALEGLNGRNLEVGKVSVAEFEGDLNDLQSRLTKRIQELQSGLQYVDYLSELRRSNVLDAKEFSQVKSLSEELLDILYELLIQGATQVSNKIEQLDGSVEAWGLKDYLERYRGEYEDLSKFKEKVTLLTRSLPQEFKIDSEVMSLKRELNEVGTRNLNKLHSNIASALDIENCKLKYVQYLISKGHYSKDDYYTKLA